MSALTALFIGGNGVISAAASRLAVERGVALSLLTRGGDNWRGPVTGAEELRGDASDPQSVARAIGDRSWDVVVDFHLFDRARAQERVDLFSGRTRQYVVISSAAAYGKPVRSWPIAETALLGNPFWPYAQGKIEVERVFSEAHERGELPVTIVRPSHTYDPSLIPLPGGWTTLARIERGAPIVVHGDGTSLWTLTHQADFGLGLVGLLGNPSAIGEAVHITTDLCLTWDQIAEALAAALGAEPRIVHVASQTLAKSVPEWAGGLLGDWSFSELYDNARIKRLVPDFRATVPFSAGAREIVAWHRADPARRRVDASLDERLDQLVRTHG